MIKLIQYIKDFRVSQTTFNTFGCFIHFRVSHSYLQIFRVSQTYSHIVQGVPNLLVHSSRCPKPTFIQFKVSETYFQNVQGVPILLSNGSGCPKPAFIQFIRVSQIYFRIAHQGVPNLLSYSSGCPKPTFIQFRVFQTYFHIVQGVPNLLSNSSGCPKLTFKQFRVSQNYTIR